jgi:hypothetical protein
MSIATARPGPVSPALVAGIIALVFAVLAASAMLHTSTTFDEIVFLAVGARGFHTGDFGLILDHPRLPQYLYGLLPYLSGISYPSEAVLKYDAMPRYIYSRELLWSVGNSAESLMMLTRLVAVAIGTATVVSAFILARRHMGVAAALIAAILVAFTPDMLAHSGVAYSDIVLSLGFLLSLYAIDAAVRDPTPRRAALAGIAFALTACVKYSGLILGPIAVALLALEAAAGRWSDRAWRHRVLAASLVATVVVYLVIVIIYLGDWRLAQFTDAFGEGMKGNTGRAAFLLGERWVGGRWYFFPVAFFLKTPAGFHVLMLLACVGAWITMRGKPWREWLAHGARAPAVGAAFFLAGLVTADLNIGFRHALPMLPPLCILVAQGLEPLWSGGRIAMRAALALVLASIATSTVSTYPYFLSYVSEYIRARPLYETIVDTNTDWGGGLVGLRDFMRENGIREVALGYLGSAVPLGYEIRYVPMPSYFTLPVVDPAIPLPRYLVVSASLLAGLYVAGDPYAPLRDVKPIAVVGGSLYVFDRGSGAQR